MGYENPSRHATHGGVKLSHDGSFGRHGVVNETVSGDPSCSPETGIYRKLLWTAVSARTPGKSWGNEWQTILLAPSSRTFAGELYNVHRPRLPVFLPKGVNDVVMAVI